MQQAFLLTGEKKSTRFSRHMGIHSGMSKQEISILQETLQSTCMIQEPEEFDVKIQMQALLFLQFVDCTMAGDMQRNF